MAASCSRSWIAGGGGANPNGNLPRISAVSLRYLPLQRGFAERWILSLRCISDGQSVNGSAGEVSGCSYGRAEENARFVRCFRQAWPYISGHRGSTFVVVISGEIVDSPYLDSVLQDISLLHGLGIKFVVVPGTHVLIEQLLEEKGIKGKYVGPYQTSDSKLLEAAMEVAGRISLAIETKLSPGPPILSLRRHGDNDRWHELGVCVTSGNFLVAKKRVVDGNGFGSTGEVKKIDVLRIREWLDKECLVILSNLGCSSAGEVLNCNTYEVAAACALAIKADKLICITDGKILDEQDRPIRFMTLDDADMLIRKRSKQSAVTENYVQVGGEELICSPGYIDSHRDNNLSWNEKAHNRRHNATFHNGVGFDNGNGLWYGKQGFAIGGEERPSRLNGYLSELATAAYVCRGGVQRAHVIDGTLGGSLLLELFTRDGVGTMVAGDVYEGTRSAITADLPGIKRVIQPLEESGVLIKRTDEELLKQLDSIIVVERDGSVIACAALIPFPDDNCGEVAAIVASPECRGQGQGGKMLDFIEKKALSLGLKRLFLLTTRAADWRLLIIQKMAVAFANLNVASGLQKLNDYLLTRSYITGYQASKDDIAVYGTLNAPPSSEYVNAARWYNHIDALLRLSGISEEGKGVKIESSATVLEDIPATPAVVDKATAVEDDDDVDLFGEETEEEKKAAEERAAAVKASAKKKESGKSSVLLDVKPWDDETDMKKLEEAVRSVQMDGLLWGASKLVPVGYGIKKLQIMMTIVDDLVSVDNLIEDYLCAEPANEYIQSCDIVAFNKI